MFFFFNLANRDSAIHSKSVEVTCVAWHVLSVVHGTLAQYLQDFKPGSDVLVLRRLKRQKPVVGNIPINHIGNAGLVPVQLSVRVRQTRLTKAVQFTASESSALQINKKVTSAEYC